MIRVGLTGGIACGKSYVRARLEAAGFRTVDLDAVAHAVMAPGGSAYTDVVAALLVETGQHARFERLVVVHCPPEAPSTPGPNASTTSP